MLAIEQQNRPCQHCQRITIHSRNVDRMNWLLHIVVSVVTFGAWLFFALLIALSCGPTSGWVCSQCGTPEPSVSVAAKHLRDTDRTTWAVLFAFIVAAAVYFTTRK